MMRNSFRYYLTQRPPMPGTFPSGATKVVSFDDRTKIKNLARGAWGYVEYATPLDLEEIGDYELMEAGPFYMSKETGEILSKQAMLHQFREECDGDDETNLIGWDEYYEEVE